jgi:hypothetical protein
MMVGAPGGARIVVVVFTVAEAQPVPCVFTARSCTGYVVEGVSPVIRTGLLVDPGERVTQVLPLSREYW